ncbi:MAG: hypothetical protein HOO91_21420 [Bacteroidales bacterium]|nr:hypothetical protein [Bacteroidales bacterium]
MFNIIKNLFVLIALCALSSCYHRELHYSFDTSSGGVISGSSYYYLANAREFQMPKGISTFPDGGMSRDVRYLFGLFKTDTLTNSTILVTKIGKVVGWPSRYSTRLDKNSSYIGIGIINVTQVDSINGIYLYNLKNNKFKRYSKESGLPAFTQNGLLMAYCIKNKLVIDDYASKNTLFSYLLNFVPEFVTWKSDNEIYLFLSNPFRVKILNISTGVTTDTRLKFIKNFDQEIDINQINRKIKNPSKESKVILDNSF